ncbi:MAG: hypothetical protein FJ290_25280 [Planctomycetes bacterium]|nr:hypothetical protein [Planctomycetota bacterium]
MWTVLLVAQASCLWAAEAPPHLKDLPANTWVRIKPDRNPIARSYSGICYGAGLIYYFGGGHGSHPGNDVELYDVAANTWTQATEPEDWRQADSWTHLTPEERKHVRNIGGGSGVALLSPKGRPLTRHTYQMQRWFPEEKAFFSLMDQLWALAPDKREWRKVMDKAPRGSDVHTWNLAYDPDLKSLVAIVVGGPNRAVYLFDREKTAWSKRCDSPVTAWSEVYSAYDAARKRHVVRAGRRWWTLDMATGTTRFIADLADAWMKAKGRDKPPHTESVSIAYDPESTRTLVLIKGDGTELWAYDADKDDWSEVKLAGEPPKGTTHWGLLVRVPEHNCFLFLNVLGVQNGARADGLFALCLEKPR